MQAEKDPFAVCPIRSTLASVAAQTVFSRRSRRPDITALTRPRMSCEEDPISKT